jgi:two-component SAPR family response regulator
MLFYLLCHPPRTKEQIGLALWPDASTAQLHDYFRITVYHLRKALGSPDWVLFEDGLYAFNRALPYWYDVEVFEFHLSVIQMTAEGAAAPPHIAGDHLDRAAGLYIDDFLNGTESEWCLLIREDLFRKYLQALLTSADLLSEAGVYVRAVEIYRLAIAKDSYLEAAHRGLMRSLAQQGELSQALRHYQSLARLLHDELDAPPAPETVALYECLRCGDQI